MNDAEVKQYLVTTAKKEGYALYESLKRIAIGVLIPTGFMLLVGLTIYLCAECPSFSIVVGYFCLLFFLVVLISFVVAIFETFRGEK